MTPLLNSLVAAAVATGAIALTLPSAALADAAHAGKSSGAQHRPAKRQMTLAPQKPNGSGIVVRYRVAGKPEKGHEVPVSLSLERVAGADAAVRFTTDKGLRLMSGGDARALRSGRDAVLTLDVLPEGEGLHYVHVFTTQNGVTSVASIPVQVGKPGPALLSAPGSRKSTPEGEALIAIPVK